MLQCKYRFYTYMLLKYDLKVTTAKINSINRIVSEFTII